RSRTTGATARACPRAGRRPPGACRRRAPRRAPAATIRAACRRRASLLPVAAADGDDGLAQAREPRLDQRGDAPADDALGGVVIEEPLQLHGRPAGAADVARADAARAGRARLPRHVLDLRQHPGELPRLARAPGGTVVALAGSEDRREGLVERRRAAR